MFETIVCGVDGSEAGFAALAQARRLLADGGTLLAVTASEEALAARAGLEAPRAAARMRAEAEATRTRAESELTGVGGGSAVVVRGRPYDALRSAVVDLDADLLAVGSRGTTRPVGILLGSVATAMLHEAPCPVLVARPLADSASFPRSIVVGVDGSACAAEAERLALQIAAGTGATLRAIAALGGAGADADALHDDVVRHQGDPVAALEAASLDADLIVVGSRGLHGIRAIGSVSERIAHQAQCSVLVVRSPPAG